MDSKTIKHIAKLSYLEFNDKEMERFAKELSAIVDYVSDLEKAPTDDASHPSHKATEGAAVSVSPHTSLSNAFRNDSDSLKENLDEAATLLEAAPEKEGGYVKVKAIL